MNQRITRPRVSRAYIREGATPGDLLRLTFVDGLDLMSKAVSGNARQRRRAHRQIARAVAAFGCDDWLIGCHLAHQRSATVRSNGQEGPYVIQDLKVGTSRDSSLVINTIGDHDE